MKLQASAEELKLRFDVNSEESVNEFVRRCEVIGADPVEKVLNIYKKIIKQECLLRADFIADILGSTLGIEIEASIIIDKQFDSCTAQYIESELTRNGKLGALDTVVLSKYLKDNVYFSGVIYVLRLSIDEYEQNFMCGTYIGGLVYEDVLQKFCGKIIELLHLCNSENSELEYYARHIFMIIKDSGNTYDRHNNSEEMGRLANVIYEKCGEHALMQLFKLACDSAELYRLWNEKYEQYGN